MIDVGADPNTFKFKVLSPMFPPIADRLENTDHFTTQKWVFKEDMKDRQQQAEDMAIVWKEFRNFNNTKSLRHSVKHVPRNFD